MYALHLPSRHLWFAALAALALAVVVLAAGEWLTQLDLTLIGGAAAEPTVTPPPTWAEDPLTPPTILLTN
jgi:hypothetical protein